MAHGRSLLGAAATIPPRRLVSRLYDADEDWRAQDEDLDIDNVATSVKKDDLDDDET